MNWSRLLALSALLLFLAPLRDDTVVTAAQLKAVHEAFVAAKAADFSVESMVRLYQLDNAAPAVKKLVDAAQSNPARSIAVADSKAMEATRERMNLMVLEHLAETTGGSIEVINFGKQNGIRSDKDQTIFAADGKRLYTAGELKTAYEGYFRENFGIDMEKMDMSMFDGDAAIPDWRRADMTYEEFVKAYEIGQAKLEQNPEAYQEAGSYRAQVDRRTAEQGRVTVIRKNPETGKIEKISGTAAEISSRYSDWTVDVPYRNAMDAAVENKGRFEHSNDFIDKMKYFNRTVGDGVNALALENWDVNYIFHLADLDPAQRRSYIDDLVRDVFVIDVSAAEQELFKFVIATAAEIELDKMKGQTQAEDHYLKSLVGAVEREAEKSGEKLSRDEVVGRARERFFGYQKRVMDMNIVATTRQKMLRDLDPKNLRRVARKYGKEEAKKLRYETARQIGRAFEKLDDPKLIERLVSEAPPEIRLEIESLRDQARIKKDRKRSESRRKLSLADSDEEQARLNGPSEKPLDRVDDEGFLQRRRREVDELTARMKSQYEDFDSNFRAGLYSDEFITERLRNGVLDSLGFEERAVFVKMEVEYQRQFSGSKLFSNVVNLGNVSSVLSMIEVYQQTGDMTMVARTALWELVSNVPGVSQFATLKQSFNDGDYQSLSWLFIAWKIPGAGQAKMVFDATKMALTIVYNHAMIPLDNDRFSQVYMGYVDKQAAGWSPLVPGWKERREAVSLSILQFVPGETFGEKRSNMYSFFQARLNEKLIRNGLDPTTDEYWERRDQVLPAFFGAYVDSFFDARDEFDQNTTIGLRAVAKIPELKRRLIARLLADFEQGELNYRLAEVAREEMMEAIAGMQAQQQENIKLERRLVSAEDFVTETLRSKYAARIDSLDLETEEVDGTRVAVAVYPRTVIEGQEVTFAVKAVSADDERGGEEHSIEVKRVAATALAEGETDVRKKLAETIGENDALFVKPLLDRPKSEDAELYVTRVDYEVVVRDPEGRETAREILSVNVAGLVVEEPETSDAVTVKVRITEPPPEEERKRNPFGAKMRIRWEDPTPENCNPAVYNPQTSYSAVPHLWLRWDEMPEGLRLGARMQIEGGVPQCELSWFERPSGQKKFEMTDGRSERGNCFILRPRIPRGTAGNIVVTGAILGYEKGTSRRQMENDEVTAVASFPFRTTIVVHPPNYVGSARASLSDVGILSGSVGVKYCQEGQRPGRVDVGGKSFHGTFSSGGVRFRVPGMAAVPDTVTLHFRDFGRDRSIEVPVESRGLKPRAEPNLRYVEDTLEELKRYESAPDDRHAAVIAALHGNLASRYSQSGSSWIDRGRWLAEIETQLEWMARAHASMARVDWKGWSASSRALPTKGRGVSGTGDPAKSVANARAIREEYRTLQMHVSRDAAEIAFGMGDLELGTRFIEQAEGFTKGLPDNFLKVAAHNIQLTRSHHARRHYEATGDLERALALHQLAENWMKVRCRLSGVEFKSRRFGYDVGENFDRGDR